MAIRGLFREPRKRYQFNTREWFSDQNLMLMNDAQTGWYIRLKALAWDSGGFLPADSSRLWKLAKARSKNIFERDCDLVLAEYEEVEVDGERKLKHPHLAAKYAHTLQEWMKKKPISHPTRDDVDADFCELYRLPVRQLRLSEFIHRFGPDMRPEERLALLKVGDSLCPECRRFIALGIRASYTDGTCLRPVTSAAGPIWICSSWR